MRAQEVIERGAGRVPIGDDLNEWNQKLVFVFYGLYFVVRIEDFGFVQTQRLGNVLISMGVNGFLKSLAQ